VAELTTDHITFFYAVCECTNVLNLDITLTGVRHKRNMRIMTNSRF